ncbi:MAG: Ig-like domain-containing protein [Magnetococcales bacterium]|nr:Ig-like domain-containing protein [Magnetococcales bacterium]
MWQMQKRIIPWLVALLLAGCGGGGSGQGSSSKEESSTSNYTEMTGTFHGSVVVGLPYTTKDEEDNTISTGVTDEDGEFTYYYDSVNAVYHSVTFHIGNVTLGSATPTRDGVEFSAFDLVDSQLTDYRERVDNIERYICIFDADFVSGSASECESVTITDTTTEALDAVISTMTIADISDTTFDTNVSGYESGQISGLEVDTHLNETKSLIDAAVVSSVTVAVGADSVVADGEQEVLIEASVTGLVDADTTAGSTESALAGVLVRFATTAGSFDASSATAVTTREVLTDEDGIARWTLIAPTNLGTTRVTATAGGYSEEAEIAFIAGAPAEVIFDETSLSVGLSDTVDVGVTVLDAHGNPVSGETVTFVINGELEGVSLEALTGVTDDDGWISVTFNSGDVSSTDGDPPTVSASTTNGVSPVDSTDSSTTFSIPITVATTATSESGAVINDIVLLTSNPQIDTDGVDSATLTAILRDENDNLLEGETVQFKTVPYLVDDDEDDAHDTTGSIQVTRAITDDTGTAVALLTAAPDQLNRMILVQATDSSGTLESNKVTLEISGSTLTVAGVSSAQKLGETLDLTVTLADSSGSGVADQFLTVSSTAGNTLLDSSDSSATGASSITVETDTSGEAAMTLSFDQCQTDDAVENCDIVSASLDRTTGNLDTLVYDSLSGSLTIARLETEEGDDFAFETPDPDATEEISLVDVDSYTTDDGYAVSVLWTVDDVAQEGEEIEFQLNRGWFLDGTDTVNDQVQTITVITDSDGRATVNIYSDQIGPAIIQVSRDDGLTLTSQVEFISITPDSMLLQASPSSIGTNREGDDDEQSTITAIVRDSNYQGVKNQTVIFVLDDRTGGYISAGSAVTDSSGQASVSYVSGTTSSDYDGISISAHVDGYSDITGTVSLTVSESPLFITLGTGNSINESEDGTRYELPYTALVTDVTGLPAAGVELNVSIWPVLYYKGTYDVEWSGGTSYDPDTDSTTYYGDAFWARNPSTTDGCSNEDSNQNGVLDLDLSEDINGNDQLDPGNVATLDTATLETDSTGFASFNIVYPQNYGGWVKVRLTARGSMSGTESERNEELLLPISAEDQEDTDVNPPGVISPFGTGTLCTDTE